MNVLIDTNILIPLEPTSHANIHQDTDLAARFASAASKGGIRLFVHPVAIVDIDNDSDIDRRDTRRRLLKKYPSLEIGSEIDLGVVRVLGEVEKGTNDWVDHVVLTAVFKNAVHLLITNDVRLRNKAKRVGLGQRVVSLSDGIVIASRLFDKTPTPHPYVVPQKAFNLRANDPIFDSIRVDYPEFDAWLVKAKQSQRDAWIVRAGDEDIYASVMIVKHEQDDTYGLLGKVLKISTFKVSEDFRGNLYGELLLKTLFDYARANSYSVAFVEVFDRHAGLIELFEEFGFEKMRELSVRDETVMAKTFVTEPSADAQQDGLLFNIKHGPFAVKWTDCKVYAVPIQPMYHEKLFPEFRPTQLRIEQSTEAFGNAIKKAYLCNASTRSIAPGDLLLFYRSIDLHSFTALGVAEDTLATTMADEVMAFVGKRTVYSATEIQSMAGSSEIFAILFRLSRLLDNPISLEEMKTSGFIKTFPQSIMELGPGVGEWLRARFGE